MSDAPLPALPDPQLQLLLRLIPKVGDALAQYKRDRWERETRRIEELASAVEERISMDDLFEAIANDERVEGMFRAAVESAQRATSADKVRLLGRALASGALANDDARIDEAQVLLRLAADLDAPEIRALALLISAGGDQKRLNSPHRLLQRQGYTNVVLEPILARLVHLGLLSVESEGQLNDASDNSNEFVDVTESWIITDAAEALFDLLQAQPGDR